MNKFKNVVISDNGITTIEEVHAKHDLIDKFVIGLKIVDKQQSQKRISRNPISKIISAVKNAIKSYNKALEAYYQYLDDVEAYGIKNLEGLK